jgi:hypothetical protein
MQAHRPQSRVKLLVKSFIFTHRGNSIPGSYLVVSRDLSFFFAGLETRRITTPRRVNIPAPCILCYDYVCFVQTNDLLTLWLAFDYDSWTYYATLEFISNNTDQKITINWSDGRTEEIPAGSPTQFAEYCCQASRARLIESYPHRIGRAWGHVCG